MDQLKKHGPTKKAWTIYIGPCFLFQGWTDKGKKDYKRQKSWISRVEHLLGLMVKRTTPQRGLVTITQWLHLFFQKEYSSGIKYGLFFQIFESFTASLRHGKLLFVLKITEKQGKKCVFSWWHYKWGNLDIIHLKGTTQLDKGISPICGCHRDIYEFVTLSHVMFEDSAWTLPYLV